MKKSVYVNFIIILFYLSFSLSCQNKSQNELIRFNIEKLEAKSYKFDEVFTLNQVIVLEESDSSLLSGIVHIKEFNNDLYISDIQQDKVYRFSSSGKFLNTIGSQGRGPGELLALMNFQLNNSTIWIMDLYKFVQFDLDGKLIKEYSKPSLSFDFIQTNNEYFIYNMENPKWHQIVIKDSDYNTITSFSPFKNNQLIMPMSGRTYIMKDQQDIFITYPFSDTIYKISDTLALPNICFGFGQRKLTNYNSLIRGNFNGDLSMYDYSINDFITDEHIISNLILKNDSKLLIFNRMTYNLNLIDSLTNGPDLINGAQIYSVANDGMCYWAYNRASKNMTFDSLKYESGLNDNPILIQVKLKSEIH